MQVKGLPMMALACLAITGCSVLGQIGGLGVGPGAVSGPHVKPQPKAAPQTVYRIDDERYFIVKPVANTSCREVSLTYSGRMYEYSKHDARKLGVPEVNYAVVSVFYEPAPGSLSADASSTRYLLAPPVLDTDFPDYFFVPFSDDSGDSWHYLVLPRSGPAAQLDLVQRGTLLYFDHDSKVIDLSQDPPVHLDGTYLVNLTPWRSLGEHEVLPAQGRPSLDTQATCVPHDLPFRGQ